MYNDYVKAFKAYVLLALIIIIASFLRLYNLSGNPPGLTWDEAALGYNAYSILKTGRDEYGQILPITLKSFGDYKPALYAYLDIPFIAILGLNELSVRLPSALLGIGTVILIYFLTLELFNKKWLSLATAFLLSISPYAIQFSRPAFEVNMALFLNVLGTYLFILGIRQRKLLIWSMVTFVLSILTYQASKMFVPLLFFTLLFSFKDQLRESRFLKTIIFLVISLILVILLITFVVGKSDRLATLNFFAYQRSQEEIKQILIENGLEIASPQFEVLHGEWWAYTRGLVERYLIYFSPKMLFVEGDYNQRHRVPDLGVLYYFSAVLIPLGVIYFVTLGGKSVSFIFLWLLLAPLPAVLSRDLISMLRALNMVVPLTILEAAGAYYLLTQLKLRSRYVFIFGSLIIATVVTVNLIVFLDRYFIHAPKEYSQFWLSGYTNLFHAGGYTSENLSKYNKVVVSDAYGQPYIFYVFFTKYPPKDFQKQAVLDQPTVDVGTVRKIDNIEFRHVYWPVDRGTKKSLFVGSLEELPDKDVIPFPEYKILKDVYFANGAVAFRIVESE